MRSKFSESAGRLVTHKPGPIIVICLVLLGGLAAFFSRVDYIYGVLDSFPEDMPSREGFSLIAEHYPPGEIAPVQLIIDSAGNEVNIKEELESNQLVESVSDPAEGETDSDFLEYSITLSVDPYSSEAVEQIPILKEAAAEQLREAGIDNPEEQVWLGGQTANLYDTEEVTSRDQNVIIPVVLLIIAILLMSYLRSITAMIYLLVTVVLSFLSAVGLGWIVIHYLMGEPAMQGLIPLYAFVFLVALGGDYNIFMISSIWKNRKTMPLKKAIAEGVGETSSVITSAGLILAGTFSVLAVRPLLVPAITMVLGRYAFWPGKLWKKKDTES